MKRKVIIKQSIKDFDQAVEIAQDEDWVVVPNSLTITTGPNATYFAIVVEKDGVNTADLGDFG